MGETLLSMAATAALRADKILKADFSPGVTRRGIVKRKQHKPFIAGSGGSVRGDGIVADVDMTGAVVVCVVFNAVDVDVEGDVERP